MSSGCFHCRNHCDDRPHPSGIGWAYSCRHGLDTEQVPDSPDGVLACSKGDVQYGFQIGGYYRHMYFEGEPPVFLGGGCRLGGCLDLHIQGDAEFPQGKDIELELCEFQQLEEWVKFWGKELRRRGWVVDEPEEDAEKMKQSNEPGWATALAHNTNTHALVDYLVERDKLTAECRFLGVPSYLIAEARSASDSVCELKHLRERAARGDDFNREKATLEAARHDLAERLRALEIEFARSLGAPKVVDWLVRTITWWQRLIRRQP